MPLLHQCAGLLQPRRGDPLDPGLFRISRFDGPCEEHFKNRDHAEEPHAGGRFLDVLPGDEGVDLPQRPQKAEFFAVQDFQGPVQAAVVRHQMAAVEEVHAALAATTGQIPGGHPASGQAPGADAGDLGSGGLHDATHGACIPLAVEGRQR